MDRHVRRRRVLATLGTVAGTGLLAGCTDSDDERTDDGSPVGSDDSGGDENSGTDDGSTSAVEDGTEEADGTADASSGEDDGASGGDGTDEPDGDGTSESNGDGDAESGEPDWPAFLDRVNADTYEDRRGEAEVTVEAGTNYFDPTKLRVDPGTTIRWEFVDPRHNAKPEDQPADDFEGTPGGPSDFLEAGDSHSETLETDGMYTYYCVPHKGVGMKGAILVE